MTREDAYPVPRTVGLLAAMLALILVVSCSSAPQRARSAVKKTDAIVKLECDVADAEVWVNDRFVAHVRGLGGGIGLTPGTHRLEFRHDTHHTHYEMITLTERERRTLIIKLAEILP